MFFAFYDLAQALKIELRPMNSSKIIDEFKFDFQEKYK